MTDRKKEFAKFAAGFVVCDFLTLAWLLAEGHLPISVLGIEVTQTTAMTGLVIDAVLASALIYYAWFGGQGSGEKAPPPRD